MSPGRKAAMAITRTTGVFFWFFVKDSARCAVSCQALEKKLFIDKKWKVFSATLSFVQRTSTRFLFFLRSGVLDSYEELQQDPNQEKLRSFVAIFKENHEKVCCLCR